LSTNSTKSEQAREFFRSLVADGFDFRNSDARIQKIKDFCTSKKWNYDSDRAIFYEAFRKVLKEQGIDPRKFEIKPKSTKYSSSEKINVTVEPKPKGVLYEGSEAPKQEAPKEQKQEQAQTSLSIDTISNLFDVPVNIVNIRYPKFKKLTPEEKKSLGESWKPIFDKYLNIDSKFAIWIAPVITTLGILASRADAFVKSKEDNIENNIEINQELKKEIEPKNDPKWLDKVSREKKRK